MKLEPVTKLDNKNTRTSKKRDDAVVMAHHDVFVILSICASFITTWKQNSGLMVYGSYTFVNSNFYLTKSENKTKESQKQLQY